jgi:hypothetical protein
MRKRSPLNRFKHLNTEQKAVSVTAILTFIFCFMPWYAISSRTVSKWWSGFENIGSVGGYLIAFLAIVVLAITILPTLGVKLRLPWKNEHIVIALSAEAAFLAVVFLAVYIQYSLHDSLDSSTSFGIYLTIVSTFAMTIAAIALNKSQIRSPYKIQDEFIKVPRQQQDIYESKPETTQDELSDVEVEALLRSKEEIAVVDTEPAIRFNDTDDEEAPKDTPSFNF